MEVFNRALGLSRGKWLVFSLGFASFAAAAACTVHYGVSFDKTLVDVSPSRYGAEIGDKLQQTYGAQFGVDHDVEGIVRYTVKLPFGLQGGLQSIPFHKPCGATFKDVANEMWPLSLAIGGGGMCPDQGSGSATVVGYNPIYTSVNVCVAGSCSTQTVLIGYTPIFNTINQELEYC